MNHPGIYYRGGGDNTNPGHSLITEDEGIITGIDNCKCGRLGKTIKILGRIKSAELRGCSDTYAEDIK